VRDSISEKRSLLSLTTLEGRGEKEELRKEENAKESGERGTCDLTRKPKDLISHSNATSMGEKRGTSSKKEGVEKGSRKNRPNRAKRTED